MGSVHTFLNAVPASLQQHHHRQTAVDRAVRQPAHLAVGNRTDTAAMHRVILGQNSDLAISNYHSRACASA